MLKKSRLLCYIFESSLPLARSSESSGSSDSLETLGVSASREVGDAVISLEALGVTASREVGDTVIRETVVC
jgi:hypothetical protein